MLLVGRFCGYKVLKERFRVQRVIKVLKQWGIRTRALFLKKKKGSCQIDSSCVLEFMAGLVDYLLTVW